MESSAKNEIKESRSWILVAALLIGITVIATALRFYDIGKLSFWGDELDTMQYVSNTLTGMFRVIWPTEMNMSLYYLIVNIWMRLFVHPSEGQLRAISAIFSIASIPAIFFLGKTITTDKKFGNAVGLLAAFLIAINAYHIEYAQELRTYSLTFLLAILSTLLFIKAVENPKSKPLRIGYILVSVAGVYAHYFIALLIMAQAVSLIAIIVKDRGYIPFAKIFGTYFLTGILIVPIAVAALLAGTGGLGWVTKPSAHDILEFTVAITGNQGLQLLILYVIAASIGIGMSRSWPQKTLLRNWMPILFASCLFLPTTLVILISEVKTPLFVDRYFMFTMSFLAIFAAMGIVKLFSMDEFTLKLSAVLLLVLITFFSILGVQNYFTNYQKEDWRGVASFLIAECDTTQDLRLFYPTWTQEFTAYYQPQTAIQNQIAEDRLDNTDESKIESSTTGYSEVCLVVGKSDGLPNINVIQTALQTNYPIEESETKFAGPLEVDIYTTK